MTCNHFHNFGAHSTRQGTASLGRIKPLVSAGWIVGIDALMEGVTSYPEGGRKP